jgi:3-polyprenyl-4-hydroxybenzoate decarboxylase
MTKRDITSMRSTIDFLKKENGILTIKNEVDPIYEIAGIQKKLEGGPALLFENIKGYPGVRDVGNVFANKEIIAKIFGVESFSKLKWKCHEAIKHRIPPKVVDTAPCQEIVITKNIDVVKTLPILKHSEEDGGRIIGGGNNLISGKYYFGSHHISFNRIHFRDKDWATLMSARGTHLGEILYIHHRGEKIPFTINIGTPPAVILRAAPTTPHVMDPIGDDELAEAGGIQGSPIEIVKAKTVDAYAIAQSEWVIEGYLDAGQRIYETEEAERLQQSGAAPFFPEWSGVMGRAVLGVKVEATAITHRADRPIFYSPLASSLEGTLICNPFREAYVFELVNRYVPEFVVDLNTLDSFRSFEGVVFQVRKSKPRHEGLQRLVIYGAFVSLADFPIVIVVDEDVDIYSAEDILWAITARVNPATDLITAHGAAQFQMRREIEAKGREGTDHQIGLGIDATSPFETKWASKRPRYPVDKVDLKKWLSNAEITSAESMQSEYAKVLARLGT